MSKKVLNTIPKKLFEDYCQRARAHLENHGFEVITYQGDKVMSSEEIIAVGHDICGAIVGCDEWTEQIFSACPNLRVIARFGVGVDQIDLEAAKQHGVKVVIARGMNSPSVAEMTIAQVLAVYRNLIVLDRTTRSGDWMRYAGRTVTGKKYGLVGFGAVAQNVAKILSGFGLQEIIAYDTIPNLDMATKLGVRFVSFETLIKEADIISLHVPCVKETIGLINENTFSLMKDSAILINMARGPIVDEHALYKALMERRIAGAGIDVFTYEPTNKLNPLFALDNIVVTPHQAADTVETFDAVSYFNAQTIIDVMDGKEPVNWINR